MAFTLELVQQLTQGSVLIGPEDAVPPTAGRVFENTRLDRVRSVPVSRLGQLRRTSAPIDPVKPQVIMHTRLFGQTADYGYAQVSDGIASNLTRMDANWQNPAILLDAMTTAPLSETNFVDGATHPWKYFVGNGIARKDDGTTFLPVGTPEPPGPPLSASVGNNLSLEVFHSELEMDVTDQTGQRVLQYWGQSYEGVHNGPANSATLIDTTRNFLDTPVCLGTYIVGRHLADGARFWGWVTDFTATQLTSASGWSGHTWQPGDRYHIVSNMYSTRTVPGNGAAQGTATGGSNTTLVDTTKNFAELGVTPGMEIWNRTTGGRSYVSSLGTTTNDHDTILFTGGLAGSGDWSPTRPNTQAGDQYTVINNLPADDDWILFRLHMSPTYNVVDAELLFVIDRMEDFLQDDPAMPPSIGYPFDFYKYSVPFTEFNQTLRLRKSSFQLQGAPFRGLGWDFIGEVQVHLHYKTMPPDPMHVSLGNVVLNGGYGLEGQMRYTVTYATQASGAEGPPPKSDDEVVLWSNIVTPNRNPVGLDLSNVAVSPIPSPPNPGDRLHIYRQSETLTNPTLVASVPIDTTFFLDDRSDAQLDIARILEPDNDPAPLDGTVIFGPGALQRLFLIRDRNKLRFSKHWEYHRNRAEQWPRAFELQIGDGSQEALNGIVFDQSIFVWTEDSTWQILGQGEDAFIPLPVPLSRGLAGRWPLTFGDGRIFFRATDGIYEQRGLAQQKLTIAIDTFFLNEPIAGIDPLDPNGQHLCRLVWYPHPTDPELVFLYPTPGAPTANRRLILKKNPATGQYTDCFFDSNTAVNMLSVYADPQQLVLTMGTNDSHIHQAEVANTNSDAGVAIAGRVRLGARDQGVPRVVKTYSDVLLDFNSGGALITVGAAFNRSTETVALGTMSSTQDNVMQQLVLSQAQCPSVLRRHHIALECTWSATTKVMLYQLGWHVQTEVQDLTFLDTGPLVFDTQHTLRRFHLTIDTAVVVTGQPTIDGVPLPSFTVGPTSCRQRVDVLISAPPALLRGKIFRVTFTAPQHFLLYEILGEFEPEPLPITAFDGRELSFGLVHALKWYALDIEASAAYTITTYMNGLLANVQTLGATSGRQRVNVWLPAGIKGRHFRPTIVTTTPMQLWSMLAMVKALGIQQGYTPQACVDQAGMPSVQPRIERSLLNVGGVA